MGSSLTNFLKIYVIMNIGKKVLSSFIKVFIFSVLITSCSSDDDSGSIPEKEASFVTDENPVAIIENDGSGKVTVKVTGRWDDGTVSPIERGYVYGTTPNLTVDSNSLTVKVTGNAETDIKGLEQNTIYYIRGFIRKSDKEYFYGNEIEITTPKETRDDKVTITIEQPSNLAIDIRNVLVRINVEEIIGKAPVEIGVEYSKESDFSNTEFKKSDETEVVKNSYDILVISLDPTTEYFIRPYVKYSDGSIENGGTSFVKIVTKKLKIGSYYPIKPSEFEGNMETSRFIVFDVDEDTRTAKIIFKDDLPVVWGWKKEDVIDGITIRNATVQEFELITANNPLNGSIDVTNEDEKLERALWVLFYAKSEILSDKDYWVAEENGANNAFVYNPVSKEKKSINKNNTKQLGRFVSEIRF